MKNLYLVPAPISSDISSIPLQVIETISNNKNFICEKIRTTRRYIKSLLKDFDIDSAHFIELDKRQRIEENREISELFKKGDDVCFMSEAGLPCIADPGSQMVNMARREGYRIMALSGPSSLLLALMSSGMNGQHFTFRGYLPVKKDALVKELKSIEKTIMQTGFTQIFIETPYRNASIYDQIIKTVAPTLRLHISYNLHSDDEYADTKKIADWKRDKAIVDLLTQKAPCVFILGM